MRRLAAERPDDFETRLHLAELLLAEKLEDEAHKVLEEALRLRSQDPSALRLSAQICYDKNNFEEAREKLEAAWKHGDVDPKSDLLLSRVYYRLGDRRRANELYHQAISRDRTLEDYSYLTSLRSGKSTDPIAISPGGERIGLDYDRERPKMTFNDVGGMAELKEYLRMNIVIPLQKPWMFQAYGKKVGGGILMYGPPGCGKTYIARALAGECNATFYMVGIHEVLDKYLGESEKNMHNLFESARGNAPSIIFLDEIDALGLKRADGDWGRALRGTVDTLLSEMDNVESVDKPILVIGATNTPWSVDFALRRPGRFDRIVFVPPPDQEAREEILKLHLRGKPISDIDYQKLASRLDKFSGADIRVLIDRGVEAALKRAFKSGKTEPVTMADLIDEARKMKPSTLEWLATANDYVKYSNQSGTYDQVKEYLEKNRV